MLLALFICLPQQALGQNDNFARPGAEQMQLYEAGFVAFGQGDWVKAVERFEASLRIGEMNITYLNLGRSLFKAGRCAEAKERYDKVATAPQVREPSPLQVLERLDKYRRDLSSCPGRLTVQCATPQTKVSIEGHVGPVACGVPLMLAPGRYEVTGVVGAERAVEQVEVVTMDEAFVTLEIKAVGVTAPSAGLDEGVSGLGGLTITGWVSVGLGAAALALAGGVFVANLETADQFDALNNKRLNCQDATTGTQLERDCLELNELKNDLDDANGLITVSASVGGAAVLTGVLLLLIGSDDNPEGEGLGLLWWPREGLVGVRGTF